MLFPATIVLTMLAMGTESHKPPQTAEEARALGYPTGIDVGMEPPVRPMLEAYSECLDAKLGKVTFYNFSEIAHQAHKDIERCKDVRAKSIIDADIALSKTIGWEDAEKRKASIDDTFDTEDASHVKIAKETAEWMKKQNAQN
ncbi:hypothetical protein [Sphingopyxis macrogoltabida]|uniref:Uncharacterized protein n=1 Tax=Sphingopyxis macrogoltabida TaxID=33050 RepID=A0AAC8YXK4_SPHMC|nr:hypothetical protein [Sphingopyxis macrogoltabida]ALJ11903.1 hypothetical protein LH19_03380 [Sphingopyxis macrogoltabida]AMU88086.1 hypothetical protein ATM17_03345 [Sphingopyxis macrogoltabida]